MEVLLEVFRIVERGPVHARELGLRLVAPPIRSGQREELHRLDRPRVLQVRPAAEIGELALAVERDLSVGRVNELDLVRLALPLEVAFGLVALDRHALPRPALGDLAPHLLLEAPESLFAHGPGELEVVVEAVLDRGPDRDLGTWIQALRRLSEEMGSRVAQNMERVGVVAVPSREDLDALAVAQRQPEVAHVAVRADEHGLLRKLGPDRTRSVEPGRAVGQLELGVIGKNDLHDGKREYSGIIRPRPRRDRARVARSGP